MSTVRIIGTILLAAAITFALKALPLFIFKEKKEIPERIRQLSKNLPPAIMAVLIVYCLKDVKGDFFGSGIWQLIAAVVVVISYRWKHNTFLSILLGTASYMILLRI